MADPFIIGGDMGWFCPDCPTVVINLNELEQPLGCSLPHWNVGSEAAVLGLVDLDGIPEDKDDVELGTPKNPIPLVRFRHGAGGAADRSKAAQSRINARKQAELSRRKNRPKKKRGR